MSSCFSQTILHSLPLVADRRVCLQTVLGGSEKFRLFFDVDGVSFFVSLSYFEDLIEHDEMSPGAGISGNRLAGNCWVVRKNAFLHTERDGRVRRGCEGHPPVVIAFGRALVAEVQAKLRYLRGEMDRLIGDTAGPYSGKEFPPMTTDMRLIQDGLNARGLLALPPGDMGFEPATLEAERDELVKACAPAPGSPDDFLMYGVDEATLVDDGEDADAEESDEAPDQDRTEAGGKEPPASDTSHAEVEEDEETRKKREMAAMWAAETQDRDREIERAFRERQAETGRGGPDRRPRR